MKQRWLILLLVLLASFGVLGVGGRQIALNAPPIPTAIHAPAGQVLLGPGQILEGQKSYLGEPYDPSMLSILYYTYTDLAPVTAYLKEHRLAIFSEEWTRWPGQRLAPSLILLLAALAWRRRGGV